MDIHNNDNNEDIPLTLNKDYYLYKEFKHKHPILQVFEIAEKKRKKLFNKNSEKQGKQKEKIFLSESKEPKNYFLKSGYIHNDIKINNEEKLNIPNYFKSFSNDLEYTNNFGNKINKKSNKNLNENKNNRNTKDEYFNTSEEDSFTKIDNILKSKEEKEKNKIKKKDVKVNTIENQNHKYNINNDDEKLLSATNKKQRKIIKKLSSRIFKKLLKSGAIIEENEFGDNKEKERVKTGNPSIINLKNYKKIKEKIQNDRKDRKKSYVYSTDNKEHIKVKFNPFKSVKEVSHIFENKLLGKDCLIRENNTNFTIKNFSPQRKRNTNDNLFHRNSDSQSSITNNIINNNSNNNIIINNNNIINNNDKKYTRNSMYLNYSINSVIALKRKRTSFLSQTNSLTNELPKLTTFDIKTINKENKNKKERNKFKYRNLKTCDFSDTLQQPLFPYQTTFSLPKNDTRSHFNSFNINVIKNNKENKTDNENKNNKSSQENIENKEIKENIENIENKEIKENIENKEIKENIENKEIKENIENKEIKENIENIENHFIKRNSKKVSTLYDLCFDNFDGRKKTLNKRNNSLDTQNEVIISQKESNECLDYDFNNVDELNYFKTELEKLSNKTKKLFGRKTPRNEINETITDLKNSSNIYIKKKIKKFLNPVKKSNSSNIENKFIFNKNKYLKGFLDKATIINFCKQILKRLNIFTIKLLNNEHVNFINLYYFNLFTLMSRKIRVDWEYVESDNLFDEEVNLFSLNKNSNELIFKPITKGKNIGYKSCNEDNIININKILKKNRIFLELYQRKINKILIEEINIFLNFEIKKISNNKYSYIRKFSFIKKGLNSRKPLPKFPVHFSTRNTNAFSSFLDSIGKTSTKKVKRVNSSKKKIKKNSRLGKKKLSLFASDKTTNGIGGSRNYNKNLHVSGKSNTVLMKDLPKNNKVIDKNQKKNDFNDLLSRFNEEEDFEDSEIEDIFSREIEKKNTKTKMDSEKKERRYYFSNRNLKTGSNVTENSDSNSKNKNKNNTTDNNSVEKKNNFLNISNKLTNFNLLTNKKLFTPVKKVFKDNIFQHKFLELIQENKNLINIKKKLKNDTMIIKCEGYDMLTKEASLIKTQEIEKDLPISKQFDKYAFCIKKGKINRFLEMLAKEKSKEIFNMQEGSTGNTLLIYAAQYNIKPIVQKLLERGSNPNIQNKFGNTALHLAYKNNNGIIINELLIYHPNERIKNNNGLLAWQMSEHLN